MKENIKRVLLEGKRQLLEKQKREDDRIKKELERKTEIKVALESYVSESTREFVSALLNDLIKTRLNNDEKKVLSVKYNTYTINHYFESRPYFENDYLSAALYHLNIMYNLSVNDRLKALTEDQYLALAHYCGYEQFQPFKSEKYIIVDSLFNEIISELGLTKDLENGSNRLSITKEDLDKLLMSVHEDIEQEDNISEEKIEIKSFSPIFEKVKNYAYKWVKSGERLDVDVFYKKEQGFTKTIGGLDLLEDLNKGKLVSMFAEGLNKQKTLCKINFKYFDNEILDCNIMNIIVGKVYKLNDVLSESKINYYRKEYQNEHQPFYPHISYELHELLMSNNSVLPTNVVKITYPDDDDNYEFLPLSENDIVVENVDDLYAMIGDIKNIIWTVYEENSDKTATKNR